MEVVEEVWPDERDLVQGRRQWVGQARVSAVPLDPGSAGAALRTRQSADKPEARARIAEPGAVQHERCRWACVCMRVGTTQHHFDASMRGRFVVRPKPVEGRT